MGTSFCLKCKIRKTCKKICKKLEKELKKVEQGRNSRVTIVDPFSMDLRNFEYSETGKRKKSIIYGDRYETGYDR